MTVSNERKQKKWLGEGKEKNNNSQKEKGRVKVVECNNDEQSRVARETHT